MTRTRSDHQLLVPFAAVVLAMLPAVLDQTMLATGLPVIAGDLGQISDVSWVVTAYVVAAAAATPLWGKLGDRLGRKRMLELSLALFVGASALCGAAQDITQLIVLRLRAGHRRRRADGACDGRRRRPRQPARARPLPGLHRGDVRGRDHRRAAARRRLGGRRELALGVPRQPAGRPRRPDRPAAAPARARGGAARAAARRPRRRPAGGGDEHADAGVHPGRRAARADRRDGRAVGRARRPGAPRRRPDRAAAAAAHAHGRAGERCAVPGHRRAVRDHRVRAAAPADRYGRDPDRGRAAAGPGDARDHGLDDRVGSHDLPHGPLQAVPGRRPGADDGRAGGARHRRGRSVVARDRHRAGRLRARLRDGHAGARDRGPERRRAPRARRGDRHHGLLPRPRRRRRRGRARRRVRRPDGRRRDRRRRCDRRRPDRVRRGRGAGRAGSARRAGTRRGAAERGRLRAT